MVMIDSQGTEALVSVLLAKASPKLSPLESTLCPKLGRSAGPRGIE